MPLLLEDLARETSARNRRAAERLDAEACGLRADNGGASARQQAIESARQATDYALSGWPQDEAVWGSALAALRRQPTPAQAEQLLRSLRDVFESSLRLIQCARGLWDIAAQAGAAPERSADLVLAEQRLAERTADVTRSLEHRARSWQPADPARLAQGLELAGQGQILGPEEARARLKKFDGKDFRQCPRRYPFLKSIRSSP